MRATFAFEARVVACEECGAPLVLGAPGGAHACSFCGARQNVVQASRAVARSAPIGEPERLARLRALDAYPVAPPPALEALLPGGQLLSWKVGEALARWKAARNELRSSANPQTAEQLHWLTKALAEHFADAGEPLRERALLESALDTLTLPQHRQALVCALARSACRTGELDAAEAWLAHCDPRPLELEADSAFRFARAYLDTMLGRFDAVLAILGGSPTDIPISSEHEAACVVLRANAWEKRGELDNAVQLLDHFKQYASGIGRYLASRFIEQHKRFAICEKSEIRADALQRARGAEIAGRAAGTPGVILLVALVFCVAGGLVMLVFPFSMSLFVNVFYFVGMMAVPFTLLGVYELGKSWRARRLRERGAPALAQIRHVRPGSQVTMGVPELRYRVLVLPPSGYPFEALSTFHATDELRARLRVGGITVVRFDPDDRSVVQIEID